MSLVLWGRGKSKCSGPRGEVSLKEGHIQAGEFRALATGLGCLGCTGARRGLEAASGNRPRLPSGLDAAVALRIMGWW